MTYDINVVQKIYKKFIKNEHLHKKKTNKIIAII